MGCLKGDHVLGAIVFQLLRAGWWNDYSFRCQPVDYSDSPQALLVNGFNYIGLLKVASL